MTSKGDALDMLDLEMIPTCQAIAPSRAKVRSVLLEMDPLAPRLKTGKAHLPTTRRASDLLHSS